MNFPVLKRLMLLKMKESLQSIARSKSSSNEYSSFSRVYSLSTSSLLDLLFHLSLSATYSAEGLKELNGLPNRTTAYDEFLLFLMDMLAQQLERDLLATPHTFDIMMQDPNCLLKIKSITRELNPLKATTAAANETIEFLESLVSNHRNFNAIGRTDFEK
jgi:hypothetical protein